MLGWLAVSFSAPQATTGIAYTYQQAHGWLFFVRIPAAFRGFSKAKEAP
jgi:hypothetical protein